MNEFFKTVEVLRRDDHRYYHQSRINQTLHLISAISFLVAYGLLFIDPAVAGLVGWLVSMVTRQSGHIFFEPRGYDHVNQTTYANKEAIKVGYSMRRKAILIAVWLAQPLLLALSPSLFGLIEPSTTAAGYVHDVGLIWLALGIGGVLFRTLHLFFLRGPLTGLAWMTKILTDPLHDIATYWRSPAALLRGELLDPMDHVRHPD